MRIFVLGDKGNNICDFGPHNNTMRLLGGNGNNIRRLFVAHEQQSPENVAVVTKEKKYLMLAWGNNESPDVATFATKETHGVVVGTKGMLLPLQPKIKKNA